MRFKQAAVRGVIAWLGLLIPAAGASEVPLETVQFNVNYVTTFGDSVFVLGDIPQLGSGDIRRAIKLVPGTFQPGSLPWSVAIGVPQGTTFSYRYLVRNDDIDQYRNAANGTFISNAQTLSTAAPVPPLRDLFVFSNTSSGSVLFLNALGQSRSRPLRMVEDGPGWSVADLRGEPNGRGLHGSILSTPIDTPLHRIVARSNALYNYVPRSDAALASSRQTHAVQSQFIIPTRTVNGVTGRGIQIYLPRGYAQETSRRYPVLYMHDGQNVFLPGGAFGSWRAEVAADDRIRNARCRELIIVAIDNSSNRLTEYNPEWNAPQQHNHNYNRFLAEELKPWVDANYRTLTAPEHTGILGSSFGGVASLSAALNVPGVFGRVGALSTSFWATTLDDRLGAGELPPDVRLYLDCGDTNDGGDATIAARDALLRTGRVLHDNLFFAVGFNHQHNEAAWTVRLPGAIEALFPITDEASAIGLTDPLVGDADASGDVGLADLSLLLSAFGTCEGGAGFFALVDCDTNGCIDLNDLALLLAHFGAEN